VTIEVPAEIALMQQQTRYIVYGGKSPGPIGRVLMALAAAVLATLSLVLGFFFFLAFLGVGLVVAAVMWFRLRQVRRDVQRAAERSGRSGDSVIEGDFTVVSSRPESDDRRQ